MGLFLQKIFYYILFDYYVSFVNVLLVLQPRKFKYKLRQKKRRLNVNYRLKTLLAFGHIGLVLTQPLLINSKKMFRLKIFLKRAARRGDKTLRKVWVNTFPHLPLTKKVIGSRMGKGKGKLSIWYNKVTTGSIFIETRNLRVGRAVYYLRQAQGKLKGSSKIIYKGSLSYFTYLHVGKRAVRYQSFW